MLSGGIDQTGNKFTVEVSLRCNNNKKPHRSRRGGNFAYKASFSLLTADESLLFEFCKCSTHGDCADAKVATKLILTWQKIIVFALFNLFQQIIENLFL